MKTFSEAMGVSEVNYLVTANAILTAIDSYEGDIATLVNQIMELGNMEPTEENKIVIMALVKAVELAAM